VLYQLPLFVLLMWVGYVDAKTRRIPNQANIALFCAALLCHASPASPSFAMVAANIGLGLMLTLPGYFRDVLGGGDVKLLAALSPAWSPLFFIWQLCCRSTRSRNGTHCTKKGASTLPLERDYRWHPARDVHCHRGLPPRHHNFDTLNTNTNSKKGCVKKWLSPPQN